MSTPKKRLKQLAEEGKIEEYRWLKAREEAKAKAKRGEGPKLVEWDIRNPKPGTQASTIKEISIQRKRKRIAEAQIDVFAQNTDYSAEPPPEKVILLEEINRAKQLIKEKIQATPPPSDAEIRLLYRSMVRLTADEKRIVYEYSFQRFDEDMFTELQDQVQTPEFHYEMVVMYFKSKRVCVVCPRGFAKSTTARKYILHRILHKKVRYVVIVGASEDMASQNLVWVRDQLTDNKKIIETYGHLHNPAKWAETVFETNTGIKVVAKGAGQKIRGLNEKGRPDLIYVDDLEEDEQVESKEQRQKLLNWFEKALMPALSRGGQIIVTGTIINLDSLLRNMTLGKVGDHIPFDVLFYQAITINNKGQEESLWEAFKPLKMLQELRAKKPEMFAQEFQNDPRSGTFKVFTTDDYHYYDPKDIQVLQHGVYYRGKLLHLMLSTDYALSASSSGDWNVQMVTGMDETGNLYVLALERFRTSDPFEIIEMLFMLLSAYPSLDYMTAEKAILQKVLGRYFEEEQRKRNRMVFIEELSRHDTHKLIRIKSLKAPCRAGQIFWVQGEHQCIEDEMEGVTAGSLPKYDDVLDTLADAWACQLQAREGREAPRTKVNTLAWAIENELIPTVEEESGQHYAYRHLHQR